MPLPSSFSLPVNTIVHEPDTGRSSRVPVNEHDPFALVPPISFTFPVIVTVARAARPVTRRTLRGPRTPHPPRANK